MNTTHDAAVSDCVTDYSTQVGDTHTAQLITRIHTLIDELAATNTDSCSDTEILAVAAETERASRRLAAVTDQHIVDISDRNLPHRLRYRSIITFLSGALHIGDPARRHRQIKATARFHAPTGELLPPAKPTLAQAVRDGHASPAHIATVLDTLDAIPAAIPHDVHLAAETTLAHHVRAHTPRELAVIGARLLAHLDPDGTLTTDSDRRRRRNLWLNRQQPDLMSKLTGHLDPTTRALLDVVLDTWAAPGLNNRDDDTSPRGSLTDADPEALATAATRDHRTPAQRNHDALHALLEATINHGVLGRTHRGMPTQVIIRIDEHDLRRHAGLGHTASGTLLPISDVITLAARSQQYLAVFADHTSVPLYLGRARRLASLGQRLALFASTGGTTCSAPGCDQPITHTEIHHAHRDWADGGHTNIDTLTPACPTHHHMIGTQPGQYTTNIIRTGPHTGRTAWTINPNPNMPPNPARINQIPNVATDFTRHLNQVRA
ncbi:MAG: DUF222 domain-containing protein, partial [Gordonia sp. (in: high G+C Gram-positive bacteria)]